MFIFFIFIFHSFSFSPHVLVYSDQVSSTDGYLVLEEAVKQVNGSLTVADSVDGLYNILFNDTFNSIEVLLLFERTAELPISSHVDLMEFLWENAFDMDTQAGNYYYGLAILGASWRPDSALSERLRVGKPGFSNFEAAVLSEEKLFGSENTELEFFLPINSSTGLFSSAYYPLRDYKKARLFSSNGLDFSVEPSNYQTQVVSGTDFAGTAPSSSFFTLISDRYNTEYTFNRYLDSMFVGFYFDNFRNESHAVEAWGSIFSFLFNARSCKFSSGEFPLNSCSCNGGFPESSNINIREDLFSCEIIIGSSEARTKSMAGDIARVVSVTILITCLTWCLSICCCLLLSLVALLVVVIVLILIVILVVSVVVATAVGAAVVASVFRSFVLLVRFRRERRRADRADLYGRRGVGGNGFGDGTLSLREELRGESAPPAPPGYRELDASDVQKDRRGRWIWRGLFPIDVTETVSQSLRDNAAALGPLPVHDHLQCFVGLLEDGARVVEAFPPDSWALAPRGVDQLPPEDLLEAVTQVADALAFLHEHRVVHGWVGAARVLLTASEGAVLVATEFCLALPAEKERMLCEALPSATSDVAQPLAPETEESRIVSCASDVFLMGVMMRDELQLFSRCRLSMKVDKMMEACCRADPSARPTMSDVARALRAAAGEEKDPGHFAQHILGSKFARDAASSQVSTDDDDEFE